MDFDAPPADEARVHRDVHAIPDLDSTFAGTEHAEIVDAHVVAEADAGGAVKGGLAGNQRARAPRSESDFAQFVLREVGAAHRDAPRMQSITRCWSPSDNSG
jgi:hypothetical protein